MKVSQKAIHVYVLGEHGDSQFVAWSSAQIASQPLNTFKELESLDFKKVSEEVKLKAYKIIESKGSTYYGVLLKDESL